MSARINLFAMAAAVGLSIATCVNLALAQQTPALAATVSESAPIPAAQIPQNIKDAVASPGRPAADRALDAGRRPDQMLAFFGIAPGMKVGEIFAGGGYTTQLLSAAVGPTGMVYSQNPVFPPERQRIADAFSARLKNPALKNVSAISTKPDSEDLFGAPPGSLDVVVTNMNYHDLVLVGADRGKINGAVFKALKPGGVYGIVDHSAKPGTGASDVKLHRIDEDFVIAEVEKSGFKLEAASSALRHPEDDRTWVTAPQAAGARRGTSDRFMIKFVKP
jgi:predicted methyltransferase